MFALSIQDIKNMKGTYSIKLDGIKKYIRITDKSIIIFSKVKSDVTCDIQEVKDQEIYISKQKTGFGKKSFFNCPICGERRVTLYKSLNINWFRCRSCLPQNIYKERCNAYDSGGTGIIEYKFKKLIIKLDLKKSITDKHIPFDYRFYWPCRPKHMKCNEFELILKKLTALSTMRDVVILQKFRYSTKDINRIIDSETLKTIPMRQVEDYIWFHRI